MDVYMKRLSEKLVSSGNNRIISIDEIDLCKKILGNFEAIKQHFEYVYRNTNENTHLLIDYDKHLKIVAENTKIISINKGEEYYLAAPNNFHILLNGIIE